MKYLIAFILVLIPVVTFAQVVEQHPSEADLYSQLYQAFMALVSAGVAFILYRLSAVVKEVAPSWLDLKIDQKRQDDLKRGITSYIEHRMKTGWVFEGNGFDADFMSGLRKYLEVGNNQAYRHFKLNLPANSQRILPVQAAAALGSLNRQTITTEVVIDDKDDAGEDDQEDIQKGLFN